MKVYPKLNFKRHGNEYSKLTPISVITANSEFSKSPTTSSQIRGAVWHDLNADGACDPGEPPLAGWTVFLDQNGNGGLESGEISTTTVSDGTYVFTNLAPGGYTVALVLPSGWVQTFPGGSGDWTVSLGSGDTLTNINFACKAVAPAPATTFAHLLVDSLSHNHRGMPAHRRALPTALR